MKLKQYDQNDEAIEINQSPALYLPFVNFACMEANGCFNRTTNVVDSYSADQWMKIYQGQISNTSDNAPCWSLLFTLDNPKTLDGGVSSVTGFGRCAITNVTCRSVNTDAVSFLLLY